MNTTKTINFYQAVVYSFFTQLPSQYKWKSSNRNQFHNYLETLKGSATLDDLFLDHYRKMNYYMDVIDVTMLDNELNDFKKFLYPGTSIKISDLLNKENEMFSQNCNKFQPGTNDYELRKNRSIILPTIAFGELNISKQTEKV